MESSLEGIGYDINRLNVFVSANEIIGILKL
jgi:hypothetical protein